MFYPQRLAFIQQVKQSKKFDFFKIYFKNTDFISNLESDFSW